MRLHELAAAGDTAGVERVLAGRRPPVNLQDGRGRIPLYYACREGHFRVAALLLDAGASSSVVMLHGETLLHCAKTADIALLLLDRGLDVSARSGAVGANTPLACACVRGDRGVVEVLLEYGADPNEASRPLLYAIEHERPDCVAALLDAGAHTGPPALHHAVKKGSAVLVDLLLDGRADIDGADEDGNTPLHLAAKNGRPDMVELLLERGADPERLDGGGHTPLHSAIIGHNPDMIRALLLGGASRYTETVDGRCPEALTTDKADLALLNPPVKAAG